MVVIFLNPVARGHLTFEVGVPCVGPLYQHHTVFTPLFGGKVH